MPEPDWRHLSLVLLLSPCRCLYKSQLKEYSDDTEVSIPLDAPVTMANFPASGRAMLNPGELCWFSKLYTVVAEVLYNTSPRLNDNVYCISGNLEDQPTSSTQLQTPWDKQMECLCFDH